MALNTLTLSVVQGVQGRRFRTKINGLTAGTEVTVDVDATPGFGVVNGRLSHHSLPYTTNTVAIRERVPGTGETKVTRLEIRAATSFETAAQAAALITGGRTLQRYRLAATDNGDGSLTWSVYAENDWGSTAVAPVTSGAMTIGGTVPRIVVEQATSIIPVVTGNVGALSFIYGGHLPKGMAFNTSTGELSGAPVNTQNLAGVTITAFDSTGASSTWTFSLIIDIPTITELAAIFTAGHYYVSNAAENGWLDGNNGNNGLTKATAWKTIDFAKTTAPENALIEVNPTSVPYVENSAATGSLRLGDKAVAIAGDRAVGKPIVQGTTTRVILIDTSAKQRTLLDLILDGGGTISCMSASAATQLLLNAWGVEGRNTTTAQSFLVKPTGSGHRISFQKVQLAANLGLGISGTGGAYDYIRMGGSTFANSNQVWKDAAGGSQNLVAAEGNSFVGHASGSNTGITLSGGNTTEAVLANNSASGAFANAIFNLTNSATIGSVLVNYNVDGLAGPPSAGFLLCNTENVTTGDVLSNRLSAGAGQTSDVLNLRAVPAVLRVNDNDITINATAQVKAIAIGGDGYNSDNANATAATTTKNLGDVSGQKYRFQKVTMAPANQAIKTSHLAVFSPQMKKQASPTGNVIFEFYSDNAGVPGTLLDAATVNIPAASLTTSFATYTSYFDNHYKTLPAGVYHFRYWYDGTIDGVNYVIFNANANTAGGAGGTSADGVTWTADNAAAILFNVGTGSFGSTSLEALRNKTRTTSGASLTTHQIMVGSVKDPLVERNETYGLGIALLAKNSLRPVFRLNVSALTGGDQACIYFKNVLDGVAEHNTAMQASTDAAASAVLCGHDPNLGATSRGSNVTGRNNIVSNRGAGAPYKLVGGSTITCDYDLVRSASGIIEATTSANWATWQGSGHDTHGVNADSLLPTTFAVATDFIPPNNSPAKNMGTNLLATVPKDFAGVDFSATPTVGAYNAAA